MDTSSPPALHLLLQRSEDPGSLHTIVFTVTQKITPWTTTISRVLRILHDEASKVRLTPYSVLARCAASVEYMCVHSWRATHTHTHACTHISGWPNLHQCLHVAVCGQWLPPALHLLQRSENPGSSGNLDTTVSIVTQRITLCTIMTSWVLLHNEASKVRLTPY